VWVVSCNVPGLSQYLSGAHGVHTCVASSSTRVLNSLQVPEMDKQACMHGMCAQLPRL
jgi:hypothetical protein